MTEFSGGCACGEIRYRLDSAPMFVHCCHCAPCQSETGSAFVINALIESDRVEAYYDGKTLWPEASLARRRALFE